METVQQTTQEVKRNKFAQLISNNGDNVLQNRADKLATTAEIAQQTLINDLKNKKESQMEKEKKQKQCLIKK